MHMMESLGAKDCTTLTCHAKKKQKTKNEPIISAYLKLPSFSICVPELKVPVNRSTEIPTRADL